MQLSIEGMIEAQAILARRGESKKQLATKLGLARSTVTNFFLGRACADDVFKKLSDYLEIENVAYEETSPIVMDINSTSSQLQIYTPYASVEELELLSRADSPHINHLYICLMLDYLMARHILVPRDFLVSLLKKKKLPSNWCGYFFSRVAGGYQVNKRI